ncbi:hypothetical protein IVB30_35170 [Bradyrhizobium sp. 200]|nr:hypothetical protein [Bradyrhizobium sp. 200]UPJ48267.1 hypothetical protein IVB30_35170 [Bradyrhizobium sp. 200]
MNERLITQFASQIFRQIWHNAQALSSLGGQAIGDASVATGDLGAFAT